MLNVSLNKYVCILLHKKMSTILIQFKEYKCIQKIFPCDLEQWESDEFPVVNLYTSTLKLFVWIVNPIWASTQKKEMTRSVRYFFFYDEGFPWNHLNHLNINLDGIIEYSFCGTQSEYSAKCMFLLHRSNIKVSEWVIV
jgi:hypothetical protein